MKASARTPEGDPNRCAICGKTFALEPSDPPGDATCPYCGQLLWWIRDRISEKLEVPEERVLPSASFQTLGAGSLDIVELILDFEEEFGVSMSDSDAESIRTAADAIRWMNRFRPDGPRPEHAVRPR